MFKVRVTKKNIKVGVKDDIYKCPIALALKDKGCSNVRVSGDIAFIYKGIPYARDPLVKVTDFIERFDKGRKVKPFSFALSLGGKK